MYSSFISSIFITSDLHSLEREMPPAGGKRDSEAESAGRASKPPAEGMESAATTPQEGSGFNLCYIICYL